MTESKKRKWIGILSYGVFMTGLVCLAAGLFLRNLGDLMAVAGAGLGPKLGIPEKTLEQVAEAFRGLRKVEMKLPLAGVFVGMLLCGSLVGKLRKAAGKTAVSILAGLLGFVAAFWYAEMNGIRCGDVILSLIGLI